MNQPPKHSPRVKTESKGWRRAGGCPSADGGSISWGRHPAARAGGAPGRLGWGRAGAPARPPAPPPAAPAAEKRSPAFYVVKAGDPLYGIARQFGRAVPDLLHLNNLSARAVIQPGLRLRVQ